MLVQTAAHELNFFLREEKWDERREGDMEGVGKGREGGGSDTYVTKLMLHYNTKPCPLPTIPGSHQWKNHTALDQFA